MKILLKKSARWLILSLTIVLVLGSAILSTTVSTNYDMTEYLPEESQTLEGLEVLEDTFGNHALIELMVEEVSISRAYQIKLDIQTIDGVMQVIWLDDQADISNPSMIDPELMSTYYVENRALFRVVFEEDPYDLAIEDHIDAIETLLEDETIYMRGNPVQNIESRAIAEGEVFKIILIIIPICFIILVFASRSWLEPLIVLLVLGVGVVINLGTNAFLPSVSFITLTIAAALQLAISLDYSLFFIHRYYEYKDEGYEKKVAANFAFKKSLPVITASALTTMIGFIALFLMRYRIGFDIGIVLTKGIFFSYLSVIFLLPVLIIMLDKYLEKLRHRHFMFHLGFLKTFFIKMKYVIGLLFIGFMIFGGIYRTRVDYLFGAGEYASDASTLAMDQEEINQYFDDYQTITLLLKDSTKTQELALIDQLNNNEHVLKIEALYTLVNPSIPESFIPENVINMFRQNQYTRMTVYVSLTEENEEMFAFYESFDESVKDQYETYYALGTIPSTYEIRDTVIEDTPIVIWVSIALIALVLLAIFRNIAVAILLILVIQTAIWMNIGLLAMNDRQVIYIGYLVVLALQLGATIDYAVLFANRYLEARKTDIKHVALHRTLKYASIPIMISGLVLATAGFIEMIFSNISVVSDIGLLIGRGALFSLMMVVLILPALMILLDRFLIKTCNLFHKKGNLSD